MKRTKPILSFCGLGLLLAMTVPAYADIARPRPSPEKPKIALRTSLTVVPDTKAYEARLQISESSLRELRAALDNIPSNKSLAQRIARSSTRTILAGVFMFLSLSFAGVWMARSGQTRSRKAVAAFLMGTALIGATVVITRANAGPPSYLYWRRLPQNLSKGNPTSGGVNIEIVADPEDGSGMKLIVPMKPE
jgi:hypothetical protein